MSPAKHISLGIGISIILYPFFGLKAIWFLISSTLIDIDHYLAFLIKARFSHFNPKTMFNYYKTLFMWKDRNDILIINAMHTFEFLGLIGVYAFISKSSILTVVFLGIISHFIYDFIYVIKNRIIFVRAYSFMEYFIRKSMMGKRHIDINRVHNEAIEFSKKNFEIFK